MSVLLIILSAAAAATPSASAPRDPRPDMGLFRFDEDWRRACAARAESIEASYKCLTPLPNVEVALGGELRIRSEFTSASLTSPVDRTDTALVRTMFHADVRIGAAFRVFAQVGALRAAGSDRPYPAIQSNEADLLQGFADLTLQLPGASLLVRAGRQELAFGSQRLVAVREGPNLRRAFDGFRARLQRHSASIDVFRLNPVEARKGAFDDRSAPQERFSGAYLTAPLIGPLRMDAYWLERKLDPSPLHRHSELRRSFGVRLFGQARQIDWDVEGVVQSGHAGDQVIRAWTLASDFGVTLPHFPLHPRFGIKADIASGDRRAGDGRIGTFDPLYPKLPYFSEANLVVPANLVDINPGLTLHPAKRLALAANWDLLWRHRRADAIYTAPFMAVPASAGQSGGFIGNQLVLTADWQTSRALRFYGQIVRFSPGMTLRNLGGRPLTFLVTSATLRF